MKNILVLMILALVASCQSDKKMDQTKTDANAPNTNTVVTPNKSNSIHSNQIFQEVTVEARGNDTYKVNGKARIFEGNINWTVEDGHYILAEGYATASIGAPDWGDFEFEITVQKEDANSSLVLVLFESSAKDGSHKHELPIRLL